MMNKKSFLFLLPVITAGLMAGCSGSNSKTDADSSAAHTDTTAVTTVSTPGPDTEILADTTFAVKAAIGGMAEVALGKMAAAKGSDAAVKDFGNMMTMDHGKANTELKSIAQTKNIKLPAGLDAEHQAKSDSLSKLSGADFDKGYAAVMVEGHKKTLSLMLSEATNGKDAELKAFAAKTAPVVQHHLDEILKIQQKLK